MKIMTPVTSGEIMLWGAIKIYARDVHITCGRQFIKHVKARAEKRYHKVWSKITEKEVLAIEEQMMHVFMSKIEPFVPAHITHGRFGLIINGSNCTLLGHTEGTSVLLQLMNRKSLRYIRHSGEWEQFSFSEVMKIQKAYKAGDTWKIVNELTKALLNKKLQLAEHLARVIHNGGEYGEQPMDAFKLFVLDGYVHAKTIWGEVIPVCTGRGPDGPIQWRKIKVHYRASIQRSLIKYFG